MFISKDENRRVNVIFYLILYYLIDLLFYYGRFREAFILLQYIYEGMIKKNFPIDDCCYASCWWHRLRRLPCLRGIFSSQQKTRVIQISVSLSTTIDARLTFNMFNVIFLTASVFCCVQTDVHCHFILITFSLHCGTSLTLCIISWH